MKKFITYFVICMITMTSVSMSVQAASRVQTTDDVVTIVIDPGHGGKNEGTKENGFLEKTMTMVTAQAMYDELSKYDNVEVYLTRTTDVNIDLDKRAEFAASVDADFLFSIHYNASLSHELYGSEVWVSLFAPYNAYGYQFGMVQMETMRDMGLFLRGVKTRQGDNGDYYGIIRYSMEQEIPAVIIEHCHVDEDRDVPFCDSIEKQKAFGRADALSVAKYFGLKSEELGVDYSSYSNSQLAAASANSKVQRTESDHTEPDVCQLSLMDTDHDSGTATFEISAADYDSMLLYYSYSLDGGETFSSRQPWPDCDVINGSYRDIFTTTIQIPSGEQPQVIFRAYNLYDLYTESNTVTVPQTLLYTENQIQENPAQENEVPENVVPVEGTAIVETENLKETSTLPGTTTFRPDLPEEEKGEKQVSFFSFLMICLVVVILFLIIVILSQVIEDSRRKKRRRQHRNAEGSNTHQHK